MCQAFDDRCLEHLSRVCGTYVISRSGTGELAGWRCKDSSSALWYIKAPTNKVISDNCCSLQSDQQPHTSGPLSVVYHAFSVRFLMKELPPLEFTVPQMKTSFKRKLFCKLLHSFCRSAPANLHFSGFFVRPFSFLITLKSAFLHRCHERRRILVGPTGAVTQMPISEAK